MMKLSDDSGSNSATNPSSDSFHAAMTNDGADAFGSFRQGVEHEIDGLVKLELAAERMLGEEVDLAKAYIHDDVHGVWMDISGGLSQWELVAGEWLLSAADPTRVDWQLHHWWGDEESQLRH